ncbi:MAG TPA: AI-2E family transporter [Candidatus Acidoferrales bacterium]|nr:AI-2E family transporter [Candidatus Acidoferrales bacterium]
MRDPERAAKLPQPSSGRPTCPHLWQIPALSELVVLIGAAVLLWGVFLLRDILIPVFLGLVLAHVFNPPITFVEKHGWPRPLSLGLLLAAVALALAGLVAWLGPLLLDQVAGLAHNLPEYSRMLAAKFDATPGSLLERLQESLRQFQADPRQLLEHVFATTGRAVGFARLVFGATAYTALALALVLLYFFFFCWHFNSGIERLKAYVPASQRERTFAIVARMDRAVGQFFRGRVVIALLMGVLLSIGWLITGVPYWFFLGMATGFLNIIPYLSFVSWPIAILLKYVDALARGQEIALAAIFVWPSAVYLAVQFIDNWLLTPWIQSGQTNLNAATVLLVVIIGGAIGGVLGMLFAIPLAACLKILLEELVLTPLRRWAATH